LDQIKYFIIILATTRGLSATPIHPILLTFHPNIYLSSCLGSLFCGVDWLVEVNGISVLHTRR